MKPNERTGERDRIMMDEVGVGHVGTELFDVGTELFDVVGTELFDVVHVSGLEPVSPNPFTGF